MNSVCAAVLRELQTERESWTNTRRTLGVQFQEACNAGSTKVADCLNEAVRFATGQEEQATRMVEATEDIINALTPKPNLDDAAGAFSLTQ